MQLQKQEHYINLQIDPLGDPLTTCPIQTGWEICIEPYPNWEFGWVANPDHQFGNGSVLTRTRTRSDGLEPLLTLAPLYSMPVHSTSHSADFSAGTHSYSLCPVQICWWMAGSHYAISEWISRSIFRILYDKFYFGKPLHSSVTPWWAVSYHPL